MLSVAFVSFIGSARVGWSLHHKLAPGTRSALEHGGVAPAIVDRSADLARIIEPMVKGGYYHAGQVCVSTQRIFVHADIEAEFLDRFTTRVRALRVGDPLRLETEVGPLIQPREADRVTSWVEEAVAGGAQAVVGGERLSETTLSPGVLLDPPRDARISREEVFGPVTSLYRFATLDEAMERANATEFGLSAAIFTSNLATATRFENEAQAGLLHVNSQTAGAEVHVPFGGIKGSGFGPHEQGRAAIEFYTDQVTVYVDV
jgi:acyl-CoA reductase-like NAD-dependent aldehyde dehydrogenase